MIDGSGKILEGRGEVDATAFFIHLAIHRAGVACVLHTHMPRASALCCVESFELAMCHQNSLRFAGDVAYDPTFNGLVLDNTEGERLVEVMDGKRVLMHKHHGVIVCGATVAEAFDDLYYLERAAEVQILAMSTGSPLSIISDEIGRKFREDMESDGGKARWARLLTTPPASSPEILFVKYSPHEARVVCHNYSFHCSVSPPSARPSRARPLETPRGRFCRLDNRVAARRDVRRSRVSSRAWKSPRSTARSTTSRRPSMRSPRCVPGRARVPSRRARPTNSKIVSSARLTLVDDGDDATQRGARRAHDVAVSMCASACGASGTTIEEVVANLNAWWKVWRRRAHRARADMSRASVETSERALKDTLEACCVAREELCEEFARVRARGERALERLATPASVRRRRTTTRGRFARVRGRFRDDREF